MHVGDHSNAEMDAIRSRKAQRDLSSIGARAGERREEEEETAFGPEAGLSSGGLLETQICAVVVAPIWGAMHLRHQHRCTDLVQCSSCLLLLCKNTYVKYVNCIVLH